MRKIIALVVSITAFLFSGLEAQSNPYEGKGVATYLVGEHVSAADATAKLQAAGFEVIAEYASVSKGKTLVFTNDALKAEAAKPGRAYAAVLRLFVDDQEKMISITNPIYFGKAFMQKEYKHEVYSAALDKINGAFAGLKVSPDKLAFNDLAGFRFMFGMPYYEDGEELGKAMATTAETLNKAKAYKKGKSIIFELKLSDTITLVGYELDKRTKKFVEKIGRQNAAVLPWTVSIENGQAKTLAPKYYIAVSYPMLDMGQFMGISTVPGAITKDLEQPFK